MNKHAVLSWNVSRARFPLHTGLFFIDTDSFLEENSHHLHLRAAYEDALAPGLNKVITDVNGND